MNPNNTMSEPTFNWITALENAIKQGTSDEEFADLYRRAKHWPTCACSRVNPLIDRIGVAPIDHLLNTLGNAFFTHVKRRHWRLALDTTHRIDAREAELLKELTT